MSSPNLFQDRYDNLFKSIISSGWANKSDGNVEAPTGAFAVVEIPRHAGELAEMKAAVEDPDLESYEWPPAAFYFCCENSLGQIYVWQLPEAKAWAMFERYATSFAEWVDDEDKEDLPALFINGKDLKKDNKLLLPFGKEATVLTEPKVGRVFVSFRTEHGPTRVKLFDILNIERPKS